MANVIISSNMNLPVPVVGVDPSPQWADDVNACLGVIDSHNHTTNQGVPIPALGLNITTPLTFNGSSAVGLQTTQYVPQNTTLASTVLNSVYDITGDLWWNNGAGTPVQITSGNSPVGSPGTITGLPSGTASASYAAGTFTFQSATSTPATLSIGPLVLARQAVGSKTVTITPSSSQGSNYNLTLPTGTPSTAGQALVSDTSGNLSFTSQGQLPIGSVVATFPNLAGAYTTTATTVADANGFVLCVGQTIADGTSPMNGTVIPFINQGLFIFGFSSSGTGGGSNNQVLTVNNLPSHTHTFTSTTAVASDGHFHNMAHWHQWGYNTIAQQYSVVSPTTATGTFTNTGNLTLSSVTAGTGGTSAASFVGALTNEQFFTSGSLGQPNGTGATAETGPNLGATTVSGTTDATGSGTAFSILPSYITAVYIMRIR